MTLLDHYGLIFRDLRGTFGDFAWGSRQTRQALKTGLSCVLAVLLTYWLDFKEAYWAGITTMIMMQPNVAASIRKGWMRGAGACCGCFLAVLMTGLFIQQHLTYTFAFFVLSIFGFYLGVTLKSGYFWSYFIMNSVLISMVGMTQPDITLYIAIHRSAAIALGVLVSLVVNVVLFPDYAHETVQADFERQRAKTLEWMAEIMRFYLAGDYRMEPVEKMYRQLIQGLRGLRTRLEDAGFEMKLLRGDPVVLRSLMDRLSARTEDFHGFFLTLVREMPPKTYQELYRSDLEILAEQFDLLKEKKGWSLVENDPVITHIRDLLTALESDATTRVDDNAEESRSVFDCLTFLELIFLVRRMVNDMTFKTYENTVSEVADLSDVIISNRHSDLYRFRWFGCMRSLHIPTMKYAIKGALGIVCVFWFWLWAEIPGGALNMSVAVITVLQQDLMSTTHKGLLRFTGCLVGAAAGYAFLGFQVESTLVLSITLFFAVSLFAYIWGGRPGAAYLGCQAGICYILATVHDMGATTSLAPPTERLAGIFLGVLFIWTINLLIWPEDLVKKFSAGILAAKGNLAIVGELVTSRFKGESGSHKNLLDVVALESTLQTLLTQGEITAADAAPVQIWLDQVRLLQKESVVMDPLDAATRSVFLTLNPDFMKGLLEILSLVATARQEKAYGTIRLRLARLDQLFDRLLAQLRTERVLSQTPEAQQRLTHALMVCRRLIYRLESLSDAQRRFPVFLRKA